ncbi:jg16978 [Pararge aegeria aegeria]|uniref:Jg16978 protein n=1 Tax=Pararge aegeria aegeria TaxID=348720 RepID=A0A8S4RJC4_9NEOP|nr:jg16978 [Pararge aegeria aegeria]
MVNYCCIPGCSRNSRIHKHLNFYSLPKQKHRQKQWLKLACRDDLLDKDMDKLRKTLRFCSRHFPPNTIVNRHLTQEALPSKSLPGSIDEGK